MVITSKITDYITNIVTMKKFEILRELSKCDTHTKWATPVRKMVLTDLLTVGWPQTFNL